MVLKPNTYNEANPDDPAYEKAINGFNSFFATWLNNIRSQGYEPVRASMMVNDEEVDVDLRPAAEAVPVVEEEQPEQLSLLSLEKSTEDLLVERVMQRGPLTAGKKEQIYEFAQTHPTGSEFTAFLKKLYGYEGFSGDEMGVKYAMFNSEGVTIEWQDEQGETQETKLSWARAAGVVQRLVDEGRYLETPVVSLPEPETDEPLEGETEPYDYSFEYGLLGRLKADCEYFLSEGHQHEKHLWAGSIHAQIAKMRELYTDVELRKNTDVNTGWLSSEPLTQYEYLTKLDGSKVAISVTIPTFAKGGSGKVEAGDIIMLFATDKDTGETTQPPELKYVEVLAATQSSGADKEYQAPQDDEEENPEESLPSTITLLVNTEQAQLLAHLEESNSLHLAFVYRGTRENAEKFLAAQDQFFVEPEEDTAAQDGEQGEVSDDNNAADNTSDNAAGNEPAEEQEVENTDGE